MQLIKEKQVSPIESEVLARISIIRPNCMGNSREPTVKEYYFL